MFVIITSSTEGPFEPDFDKKILPSVVFMDNSPSSSCELIGILPDIALLRSLTVCPIYMDLSKCIYSDIYHFYYDLYRSLL